MFRFVCRIDLYQLVNGKQFPREGQAWTLLTTSSAETSCTDCASGTGTPSGTADLLQFQYLRGICTVYRFVCGFWHLTGKRLSLTGIQKRLEADFQNADFMRVPLRERRSAPGAGFEKNAKHRARQPARLLLWASARRPCLGG